MAPFPLLRLPGAWSHTTRFRVDGIKTTSCCINFSTYNSYLPTIGPLQLAIHVVQNGHAEEQKSHWDKSNKGNYQRKLCMFSCLSCPSATFALRHGSFEPHECRTVARFFSNRGHIYREYRRIEPFRGVWGYPPPGKFQIWRL